MQKRKTSMTTTRSKVSSELGNLANCGIFYSCFNLSVWIYQVHIRVFPRPFTHGGGGGQVQVDKALIGGTHKGGHRPYGGT